MCPLFWQILLQLPWGEKAECFLPENLRGLTISKLVDNARVESCMEVIVDEDHDAASTSHNFLEQGRNFLNSYFCTVHSFIIIRRKKIIKLQNKLISTSASIIHPKAKPITLSPQHCWNHTRNIYFFLSPKNSLPLQLVVPVCLLSVAWYCSWYWP